MGRRKKYGVSFSWKRATGLSAAKGNLSRQIGIPLTRSGRQRKAGKALGCCIPIIAISLLILLLVTLSSIFFVSAHNQTESWLNGTWEGAAYQRDIKSSWTMRLVAEGDKYSIEYPSLSCGGEWILVSKDSNRARFRERITYGKKQCVNNGNVFIERLNDSQIKLGS